MDRVSCKYGTNRSAANDKQFGWLEKDPNFAFFHEVARDDADKDKKNSTDRSHSLFHPIWSALPPCRTSGGAACDEPQTRFPSIGRTEYLVQRKSKKYQNRA